jgi:hypothetical protein
MSHILFTLPDKFLDLMDLVPILSSDPRCSGVCVEIKGDLSHQMITDIGRLMWRPDFRIGVKCTPCWFANPPGYGELLDDVLERKAVGQAITKHSFVNYSAHTFTMYTSTTSSMHEAARLIDLLEFESMDLDLDYRTDWYELRNVVRTLKLEGVRKLHLVAGDKTPVFWSCTTITDLIQNMPDITTLYIIDPIVCEVLPHTDTDQKSVTRATTPSDVTRSLTISMDSPPTAPGIKQLIARLKYLQFDVTLDAPCEDLRLTTCSHDLKVPDVLPNCRAITFKVDNGFRYHLPTIMGFPTLQSIKLEVDYSVSKDCLENHIVTCLQPRENIQVVEIITGMDFLSAVSSEMLNRTFALLEKHPAVKEFTLLSKFICHTGLKAKSVKDSMISLFQNNKVLRSIHVPVRLESTPDVHQIVDALAVSSVTSISPHYLIDEDILKRVHHVLCENYRRGDLSARTACYHSVQVSIGMYPLFDRNLFGLIGNFWRKLPPACNVPTLT